MRRSPAFILAVFLSVVLASRLSAQEPSPAPKLEFETASVRESRSAEPPFSNFPLNPGPQYAETGGVLLARNTILLQFLVFAYKTSSHQIQTLRQSLPDWTRDAHYTIEAKAGRPASKDEMRAMMRSLLEDRFGLRMRRENRETGVLDLVVVRPGKLGPKLTPHPVDDPDCHKAPLPEAVAGGYPHQCGTGASTAASRPGLTAIGGQKVTMDTFVLGLTNLSNDIDRPVLNRTGLTGAYDFTLEWAPESGNPADTRTDAGPGFEEALGKQLGLKLVGQKAAVEFLLVDRIARPTPN